MLVEVVVLVNPETTQEGQEVMVEVETEDPAPLVLVETAPIILAAAEVGQAERQQAVMVVTEWSSFDFWFHLKSTEYPGVHSGVQI